MKNFLEKLKILKEIFKNLIQDESDLEENEKKQTHLLTILKKILPNLPAEWYKDSRICNTIKDSIGNLSYLGK